MLDRTTQNQKLTFALSLLSTTITNNSKQGMLDNNKTLEIILPTLLNRLYGYSLIDLNLEKYNHPAIDLGDIFSGRAVQITSDGSKDKMKKTIAMLEKHNLHTTYKDITFLIISNDSKTTYQNKSYTINIINLRDIAKDICSLPTEKFEPIYNYCENQFGQFFLDNNQPSIFKPIIAPSKDPSNDISIFLKCLRLEEPYVSIQEIRDGLIAFKNQLSQLTNNQRWLIYKIMDWSIRYNKKYLDEYCFAPINHLSAGINNYDFEKTSDSLKDINLLYVHRKITWRDERQHLSLNFQYNIEDFDFFSAICFYLSDNYQPKYLEEIIINCDFSNIK